MAPMQTGAHPRLLPIVATVDCGSLGHRTEPPAECYHTIQPQCPPLGRWLALQHSLTQIICSGRIGVSSESIRRRFNRAFHEGGVKSNESIREAGRKVSLILSEAYAVGEDPLHGRTKHKAPQSILTLLKTGKREAKLQNTAVEEWISHFNLVLGSQYVQRFHHVLKLLKLVPAPLCFF